MLRRRTGTEPDGSGDGGGTAVLAEPVPALDLDAVSREYQQGVPALDAVSLTLPPGRMLAVMGRSGSGKSTLLQCAAGLDRPTSGTVRIAGTDLAGLKETSLTRLRRDRIGSVFQALNLVPSLSVLENAALPLLLAGGSPGSGSASGFASGSVSGSVSAHEGYEERALRALEAVGLADRAAEAPARLSGGQQQRVAIARALVNEPEVVFADEPTGALDPVTAAEVLALLRQAVDRSGHTVVMVTHDPAAAEWADEAVFLDRGRLVGSLVQPSAEEVRGALRGLGR
ncbi:ABC transporter ATP-binding protein [Streptomyces sp. NBC_01304]|uniref:ABC transporter ATP-binding protein n=1 Tax=Streptomyces sp. NBC_01304 TaxID=2903818 RepID=UPI002E14E73F|nr:ABC transporter ATP-binding protein [Streptomyces sp. NBC_01304]